MYPIDEFLRGLDAAWTPGDRRIRLPLFGSAALFLQTDYVRGTKDGDILETQEVAAVRERLLALGGTARCTSAIGSTWRRARLVRRVRDAVDWFRFDARADLLPRFVANFHMVERDFFGVAETLVELPDDLDR
ncbi:MAG: hypothetical protein ABMA64_04115 [Myxococcota bacterium]